MEAINQFYEANKLINLDDKPNEEIMEKFAKIKNDADESIEAEELLDKIGSIMDLYTCAILLQTIAQKDKFKDALDKNKMKITDLECYKGYVDNIQYKIEKATKKSEISIDELNQMIINGSKARWQDMLDEEKEDNINFMQKELSEELKI